MSGRGPMAVSHDLTTHDNCGNKQYCEPFYAAVLHKGIVQNMQQTLLVPAFIIKQITHWDRNVTVLPMRMKNSHCTLLYAVCTKPT